MLLEFFNNFGKCIEFNSEAGCGDIIVCHKGCIDELCCGVGDFVDGIFAAIYYLGGSLYFQFGKKSINVSGVKFDVSYVRREDGHTIFEILSGDKIISIRYKSWWLRDGMILGFGGDPDEGKDFFAYVKFMLESDARRAFLYQKFGR